MNEAAEPNLHPFIDHLLMKLLAIYKKRELPPPSSKFAKIRGKF